MAEEASLAIILRARDEASATIEKAGLSVGGLAKAALATSAVVGVAAVAMGAVAVKLAADFQYTTETLVTGAGEDQKALDMVRQGILNLAGEVGQTPQKLAAGLYLIESAGFHGASGLTVLRAAAMGATVGAADMTSVSDALTSALNAYRLPASDAAHITDVLLTTVAAGKMHLSDLAENIGKVLPIAAAAHVPITQLTAAIATMTSQGTDAAMATTALRFLITNLISPSAQAADTMKSMGLSAKDLYNDLSSKGLTGALQDIQSHLAAKFPVGSQAYIAALDKMVGGTRGMTAALELTGTNMATFVQNANNIGHASDGAGKLMQGWEEHSKDFNIVMERLKAGLEAVMITIGNQLLPILSQLLTWFVNHLPDIQNFVDRGIVEVKLAIQDAATAIAFLKAHFDVILPIVSGLAAAWLAWQVVIIASNIQLAINAALAGGGGLAAFLIRVIAVTAAMGPLAAAQALWNLMLSLNPIGLIIIGIGLLIGLIVLAVTHTKEIGQAWSWLRVHAAAVWGAIVADVTGFVGGIIGRITGLWTSITGIWTGLVSGAEAAWKEFSSRPIYWLVYLVATAVKWFMDLQLQIGLRFAELIVAAWNAGLAFQNNFNSFIMALPGKVGGFLLSVLMTVANWAMDMRNAAIRTGLGFLIAIGNEIARLPGQFVDWLVSVGLAIYNQGPNLAARGLQIAQRFANGVMDELSKLPGQVARAIGDAFSNAGNQVNQALHAAGVPGFARGAVVRSGSGGVFARIGEGSEDEVVATASQMAMVGANMAAGGGGGGGTQTIIVPVSIDGRVIAQVVADYNGKKFNLQGGRYGSGAG